MTKQLLIAACVIVGGVVSTQSVGAGDGNWPVCCSATAAGFDLNVARTAPQNHAISCDKLTFGSSSCTPWAQMVFHDVIGNDGHVDGVFARAP
jgi:hypothetical protein